MVTELEYRQIITDPENWFTLTEFSKRSKTHTRHQMRHLLENAARYPHLERTFKKLCGRILVNEKLFGLWLAGELPGQRETETAA
jgi:hypothetical protein